MLLTDRCIPRCLVMSIGLLIGGITEHFLPFDEVNTMLSAIIWCGAIVFAFHLFYFSMFDDFFNPTQKIDYIPLIFGMLLCVLYVVFYSYYGVSNGYNEYL